MSYLRRGMGFAAEEHGSGETPPILAEPRPAYGTAPQVPVPPAPPVVPASSIKSSTIFGWPKAAVIVAALGIGYLITRK